jgi:hypothetical protein
MMEYWNNGFPTIPLFHHSNYVPLTRFRLLLR